MGQIRLWGLEAGHFGWSVWCTVVYRVRVDRMDGQDVGERDRQDAQSDKRKSRKIASSIRRSSRKEGMEVSSR